MQPTVTYRQCLVSLEVLRLSEDKVMLEGPEKAICLGFLIRYKIKITQQ